MNMAEKTTQCNPAVVELCNQSLNCFFIGPLPTSSAAKSAALLTFGCIETTVYCSFVLNKYEEFLFSSPSPYELYSVVWNFSHEHADQLCNCHGINGIIFCGDKQDSVSFDAKRQL